MKKSLPLLLACAMAVMPSVKPVCADGFYGSAALGLSAPARISFPDSGAPSSRFTGDTATLQTSMAWRGEIGYAFRACRIGIEVGAVNPVAEQETKFLFNTPYTFPLSGDFSLSSVMLNGYYDMKALGYSPYLMAGLGVAKVKANNVTYSYATSGGITYLYPSPEVLASTDESVLSWQVGFGAAIPLRRGVQVDLGYRYFSTGNVRLNSSATGVLHSSNLLAGLRFAL